MALKRQLRPGSSIVFLCVFLTVLGLGIALLAAFLNIGLDFRSIRFNNKENYETLGPPCPPPPQFRMCKFNFTWLPLDVGYNTYALLDKLIIMNQLMLGPSSPRWFLSAGTLLSAYRHGALMPWDIDVDIIAEDPAKFAEALKTRMTERGYHNEYNITRKPDGVWTWKLNKPCVIDRHAYYHMDIHPANYYKERHIGKLNVPNVLKNDLCLCTINNILLQCPGEDATVHLLLKLFGPNYTIPNREKYLKDSIEQVEELRDCIYPVVHVEPKNWTNIMRRKNPPKPGKPAPPKPPVSSTLRSSTSPPPKRIG